MGKLLNLLKNKIRLWVQIIFTAVTNGYFYGYATGTIYRGPLKTVCVPGLNCYSCPGALGACPIGSLQAVIGSKDYKFSFYIVGFLIFFGSVFGRFICGWLCPFGLLQDLLYKIPFFQKRKNLPGHKWLVKLKYIILIFRELNLIGVEDIDPEREIYSFKYIYVKNKTSLDKSSILKKLRSNLKI